MALVALVLVAVLGATQNENSTQKPTPGQKASREAHSLCVALMAWGIDHPPEGEYLELGSFPTVDFTRAERISTSDAKAMLVPNYFDKVPGPDPWGHSYQILKNVDPKQPWSWAARSAGPDEKFCAESYLVPQPDWDRCDDIVRVDGVLVAGPEELEEK